MLEKSTIARPYAQAVFELSQESADGEKWSAELALLKKIVTDRQMARLLNNPKVADEQLLEIIGEVGASHLSNSALNMVKVLIAARRLQYVPQIADMFDSLRAQAVGKIEVEVITAYELDQTQRETITERVANRLGKDVTVNAIVDESLIGGAVIRAGDSVIDASLSGRLQELANDLG